MISTESSGNGSGRCKFQKRSASSLRSSVVQPFLPLTGPAPISSLIPAPAASRPAIIFLVRRMRRCLVMRFLIVLKDICGHRPAWNGRRSTTRIAPTPVKRITMPIERAVNSTTRPSQADAPEMACDRTGLCSRIADLPLHGGRGTLPIRRASPSPTAARTAIRLRCHWRFTTRRWIFCAGRLEPRADFASVMARERTLAPSQARALRAESLLNRQLRIRFGVGGDQRLSAAAQIAPAQKIEPDFSPQRAFVREPARAAMARAEPAPAGAAERTVESEGRAADAGLAFCGRQNNFYGFHSVFPSRCRRGARHAPPLQACRTEINFLRAEIPRPRAPADRRTARLRW